MGILDKAKEAAKTVGEKAKEGVAVTVTGAVLTRGVQGLVRSAFAGLVVEVIAVAGFNADVGAVSDSLGHADAEFGGR